MDPNQPKPNLSLPFGLRTSEAVAARKKFYNEKKGRAQRAFKAWANAHRKVKTLNNQKRANALEAPFLLADPKKAPATLKKIKKEHPTIFEAQQIQNEINRQRIKRTLRNIRAQRGETGLPPFARPVNLTRRRQKEIVKGGIAGPRFNLPPLPPRITLSSQQRNAIRNRGILAARNNGTVRRGKGPL